MKNTGPGEVIFMKTATMQSGTRNNDNPANAIVTSKARFAGILMQVIRRN
jgi:hypothetical protein